LNNYIYNISCLIIHFLNIIYKYTFNFPGSAAFYSWSNGKLVTAEPLYENFILAPGAAKSFSQTMKFNLK